MTVSNLTSAPTPTSSPTLVALEAAEECAALNLTEMEEIIDPDLKWVLRFCDEFYNNSAKKIIYSVQRNNGSGGSCYTLKHYTMERFCRNVDQCFPFDRTDCCSITKDEFIAIWNSCIHCR